MLLAQFEAKEQLKIMEDQSDDIYLAGQTINIDKQVNGDVVAAARTVNVRDSVTQDILVAGAEVSIFGFVGDDIRASAGSVLIEGEVGDDVIAFGGEIKITEDALIHGNLIVFGEKIIVEGIVEGEMRASGSEIQITGTVGDKAQLRADEITISGLLKGESELVANDLLIGEGARFMKEVSYWSDTPVDFKNSTQGKKPRFDVGLKKKLRESGFSVPGYGFWLFYILSSFVVIALLNVLLGSFLANTSEKIREELSRDLGYGILYLLGVPILVVLCIITIIGVPVGLFLLAGYLFSLLFGHWIAALLLTHFLNNRNERSWSFWTIVFLALTTTIIIRLITLFPILGGLVSLILVAVTYGAIANMLLTQRKKKLSGLNSL